jgi:hypothetical protein|tara:strand:+ start:430 stop:687 length:258 start_codon:yes stop_codon:yes gene_type:complete
MKGKKRNETLGEETLRVDRRLASAFFSASRTARNPSSTSFSFVARKDLKNAGPTPPNASTNIVPSYSSDAVVGRSSCPPSNAAAT